MGPGNEDLGPLVGPADLHHIDLEAHSLHVALSPDLLAGGEEGLGGLGARADAQAGPAGAGVNAGNHTGEQLMLFGAELIINHAPLGLTHPLNNHLPGGLGGNAAKVAGLDFHPHHVPQTGGGELLPGFLQAHFGVRVVHHLHDVLPNEHPHRAQLLVGVHGDVVPGPLVVLFVGGNQRLGDLFDHILLGNPLLLLNEADGGKKFRTVQLVALLRLCVSFCHSCNLLNRT